MTPIHVAIIAPKDKPWPVSLSIVQGKVAAVMAGTRRFLQREAGVTSDWHMLPPLTSQYTHEFLALEERQDGTKIDRRDPRDGRGGDEGKIWNYCLPEILGKPLEKPFRVLAFVHYVSHELMHMFGVSCHAGNTLPDLSTVPYYLQPLQTGTGLTVGQKWQLITKNANFLRDT